MIKNYQITHCSRGIGNVPCNKSHLFQKWDNELQCSRQREMNIHIKKKEIYAAELLLIFFFKLQALIQPLLFTAVFVSLCTAKLKPYPFSK